MSFIHRWCRAVWPVTLLGAGVSWAQVPAAAPAAASLQEVVITAAPGPGEALAAPANSLGGEALLLQRAATLGETLSATPGASSSYYGPNASRPVLRGQDGERLQILQNGGASLDASALSADHAVAVEPLSTERIEVLRGPAALPYGPAGLGGVINVTDNRLPREALFDAQGGITGRADASYATGAQARNQGLLVEAGTDRYTLHADAYARNSADVRVPLSLSCTQGGLTRNSARICNSAAQASGGAFGGTVFFDRGYLGASLSGLRNNYGTVAEDESTIRMRSERSLVEGEWREPLPGVAALRAQWVRSNYQHTEFDAGTALTTFAERGDSLRLQARQQPRGALQGLFGYQGSATRFSADGSEAFAPYSRQRNDALFVLEQWQQPWGEISGALRAASAQVDSLGHPTLARFAAASRRFAPVNAATGLQFKLPARWQFVSNLAWNERAPSEAELYANGPHGATGAYELGNANLPKEQSPHLEAGLQWREGPQRLNLGVYVARYRNYLSLDATGFMRDADGNGGRAAGFSASAGTCVDSSRSQQSGCTALLLPELAYSAVRARFMGLEGSGNLRLLGPQGLRRSEDGASLDLEWRLDALRADNASTGQPLPRVAPGRVGATLVWASGPLHLRGGFDSYAAQSRVAPLQPVTAGYTLWNAALTWQQRAGATQLLWYARLDNLGNQLAYSASSILTQTAPGRAPLPGRSLRLGLQASF